MNAVIALEGQIGAGKTTLGMKLAEHFSLPFHAELSAAHTSTLLERFYSDRSRWAFTTQTHFISRRVAMLRSLPDNAGGILDRSLYGDRVFAEVLHEDGLIGPEEFATYSELFDILVEIVPPPDLMVYLDCSVDVAMERIRRRNRISEVGITSEYLMKLDRRYRQWFESYDRSPKLRVPFDQVPMNDEGVHAELFERIAHAALSGATRR